MQLKQIVVTGLFGKYSHTVDFPTSTEEESTPSITIIHGPNGVGKTTVLRMLQGIMSLDFDTFRTTPFQNCVLKFSDDSQMSVDGSLSDSLRVEFKDAYAILSREHKGPLGPEEHERVASFRDYFFNSTEGISLAFLSANRQLDLHVGSEESIASLYRSQLRRRNRHYSPEISRLINPGDISEVGEVTRPPDLLSASVKRFIGDALLDYRKFFTTREIDLLPRIIENLRMLESETPSKNKIATELDRIHKKEETHLRLGIKHDDWDFDKTKNLLAGISEDKKDSHALAVINTYVEFLASRADARQLVAERLTTFEDVMNDFFEDKTVRVSARNGIEISTSLGNLITETQLSSGEYQLLFLMVSALTTKRRGTVICIDEPELSMHISWQRRIIGNLIKCASRAAPQLILATHSPDVASGYQENMIELSHKE